MARTKSQYGFNYRITVSLYGDQKDKLDALCKHTRVPSTELMRKALEYYYEQIITKKSESL